MNETPDPTIDPEFDPETMSEDVRITGEYPELPEYDPDQAWVTLEIDTEGSNDT